jgi:RNA polymerase sigma-70 factor (ECF subfamily)
VTRSQKAPRPDIREGAASTASWDEGGGGQRPAAARVAQPTGASAELAERFHVLYREQFDFVFRNLRRLGVPPALVDDALQDVFVVVLRQLPKFQAGTHSKAWLFAIALRVAGNYRRRHRRKEGLVSSLDTDTLRASDAVSPFDGAVKARAARFVHDFLDGIDDEKRSVFVMAELEQMTAPEIASALGANLNTVYGRIRAVRREFALAVEALDGGVDGER